MSHFSALAAPQQCDKGTGKILKRASQGPCVRDSCVLLERKETRSLKFSVMGKLKDILNFEEDLMLYMLVSVQVPNTSSWVLCRFSPIYVFYLIIYFCDVAII